VADEELPEVVTPTELFARRLRELRKRRDWSARQLAERVAELDPGSKLTRGTLAKIESGKRGVWLDEVFTIAAALSAAPRWLTGARPDDPWQVRLGSEAHATTHEVWRWEEGAETLPNARPGDTRFFSRVAMDWHAVALLASHADFLSILRDQLYVAESDLWALERLPAGEERDEPKIREAKATVERVRRELESAQSETPSRWSQFRQMMQHNAQLGETHAAIAGYIKRIADDLGVDPDEVD
jgi:transcriptional regulator with XRE-family HTH domain